MDGIIARRARRRNDQGAGADDVVSAFSFAMHADYEAGKTSCETP